MLRESFLICLFIIAVVAGEDTVRDGAEDTEGSCSDSTLLQVHMDSYLGMLHDIADRAGNDDNDDGDKSSMVNTELRHTTANGASSRLGAGTGDIADSIKASPISPDRVLSQEDVELETLLLQRLAEGFLNETELEILLETLADIEAPESKPALVSSDAVDGNVNVYVDGFTPVPAPREVTDRFPQEIMYSFPIEASTVNETHIFIDFGKTLRGEFVRDTHVLNSYEYGKVEHRWFETPMSIFPVGGDSALGGAEKTLTLSHDGAWPTTSLDRARAEQASRWSFTNWQARLMRRARTLATFVFIAKSRLGTQLLKAAVDPNHVAKVVEFVQQNGGLPESLLVQRKHALLQKLAQKSSTSASATPSSSTTSCLHFAADSPIQITSTGAYIPLGLKLVTYKGNVVFSPLQHFDVTTGVSTFTYDSSKGVLNIYVAASSFFHTADPQELVQNPKLFVGPADGASFTVAEEGRVQDIPPSRQMYGLYHASHRIPLDYEYLFTDPHELCAPDKFNRLAEEAKDLDMMAFKGGKLPSLTDQVQLMGHIVDVIDCGTTFLRAAQQNGNGPGLLEMVVWSHFLMETTPKLRLQNVHDWRNE